jgi:glycosyltransferase involved in cell wall biosynthesis
MTENNETENEPVVPTIGGKKVLIFIDCYNAEDSIGSVLERIGKDIWESKQFCTEILIVDDRSPDRTCCAAEDYARRHPERKLTILSNPKRQGYGGNQKIGYLYAVREGFDVVVLLRGDGRDACESLGRLVQPIIDGDADVVFGSRMFDRLNARKGTMPLYKWLGNRFLTFIQNRIIGCNLSEFHIGCRACRVRALASVPFEYNSDHFGFDADTIIQLLDTQKRVKEIAVPVFSDDRIELFSAVKCAMYAIRSSILCRAVRWGIYYHPKFDYEPASNYRYKEKFGYASSHQFVLERVEDGSTVLDIGCGPGFMAKRLAAKGVKTISIDLRIRPEARENSWKCIEVDVERYDFDDDFGKVDYILVLDILEHLKSPERLLHVLRQRFSQDAPYVVITTGTVAFFALRIGLLFGSFNYSRRGVLDMDHSRLFTFAALCRTLRAYGYEIVEKRGLPAPFPLVMDRRWLAHLLLLVNRVLIFFSKGLFSYQIAVIAKPLPTLERLLENVRQDKNNQLGDRVGSEG